MKQKHDTRAYFGKKFIVFDFFTKSGTKTGMETGTETVTKKKQKLE